MNHFDIRLTPNELDYIANLLAERPWKESNTLLVNIKGQIEQQQKEGAQYANDARSTADATPRWDAPAGHAAERPARHGPNGASHPAEQATNAHAARGSS